MRLNLIKLSLYGGFAGFITGSLYYAYYISRLSAYAERSFINADGPSELFLPTMTIILLVIAGMIICAILRIESFWIRISLVDMTLILTLYVFLLFADMAPSHGQWSFGDVPGTFLFISPLLFVSGLIIGALYKIMKKFIFVKHASTNN